MQRNGAMTEAAPVRRLDPKGRRYFVALMLPEPAYTLLESCREELKPKGWNITVGPHITLVTPGDARLPVADAAARFKSLPLRTEAFTFGLEGLGRFEHRGKTTMYLVPSPHSPFKLLQAELLDNAETWQDTASSRRRPFIPHVTLLNRVLSEEAQCKEQIIREQLPPLRNLQALKVTLLLKEACQPRWTPLAERILP